MTTALAEAAPLLDAALEPLARHLADTAVEEVCVNQPGAFWVRRGRGWHHYEAPELEAPELEGIAILAGALRHQDAGRAMPICGGELHTGHRFQAVLPPCVPAGTVSLTFRRPSDTVAPLAGVDGRYQAEGWNRWAARRRRQDQSPLLDAYDGGSLEAFFRGLVQTRRNVLFCGATGGGKTYLSKTLVAEISATERIITIEDALELTVPQPNNVRLLYSKSGVGMQAEDLLEATLRMRPDRVMLQEMRDAAAYTYLNEVMTGHPGSMTTIHGEDAAQAFKRMFALVKGSPKGRALEDRTVAEMLSSAVDAIVPLRNDGGVFSIGAIWFADDAARCGETAASLLAA